MKTVITRVFAILALCLGLIASILPAQTIAAAPATPSLNTVFGGLIDTTTLPANLAVFGAGVNSGTTLHGVTAFCHAVTATNYVCAESLLSGSTTANTVSDKQVIAARKGWVLVSDVNAGVATGADSGLGAAVLLGGSVLYNISRVPALKAHPGYWVGFSAQWDKRDVQEFATAATTVAGIRVALRPFATKGDYTFFAGKSW